MASDKQKETARENGRKSKGPVTARGKEISSQNARKHGHVGSAVVLPGESRKRFDRLHKTYYDELDPTTAVQRNLVDAMVVCQWRKLRIWTMETTGVIQAGNRMSQCETYQNDLDRDTAALLGSGTRWDLLQRYEAIFDRQYHRNLRQFQHLKALEQQNFVDETNPGTC